MVFGEGNWAEGYFWFHSHIKGTHESLDNRIEIKQAFNHHKSTGFDSSIRLLKGLEKNKSEVRDVSATNISFLYFLERNFKLTEDYRNISVKTRRYNSKALVNKGNCLFIKSSFIRSREIYFEAIVILSYCVQEIYNLGLENVRLDIPEEAIQDFERLLAVFSNNIFYLLAS